MTKIFARLWMQVHAGLFSRSRVLTRSCNAMRQSSKVQLFLVPMTVALCLGGFELISA